MTKGTIQNQESFLNRIASSLGRERRTGGVAVPEWAHQPQYKTTYTTVFHLNHMYRGWYFVYRADVSIY